MATAYTLTISIEDGEGDVSKSEATILADNQAVAVAAASALADAMAPYVDGQITSVRLTSSVDVAVPTTSNGPPAALSDRELRAIFPSKTVVNGNTGRTGTSRITIPTTPRESFNPGSNTVIAAFQSAINNALTAEYDVSGSNAYFVGANGLRINQVGTGTEAHGIRA